MKKAIIFILLFFVFMVPVGAEEMKSFKIETVNEVQFPKLEDLENETNKSIKDIDLYKFKKEVNNYLNNNFEGEIKYYNSSKEYYRIIINDREEFERYLNTPFDKLPQKYVINNIPYLDELNKRNGVTLPIVFIEYIEHRTTTKLYDIIYFLQKISEPIAIIFFSISTLMLLLGIFSNKFIGKGFYGMLMSCIVFTLIVYSEVIPYLIISWFSS